MFVAPQQLRLSNQAAEVTRRPLVTRGPGDRQHPLRRHPTLRLRDTLGDQLGHGIVIVGPLGPRRCGIAGLELLHDFLDGPMGGVAELGGPSVRPDLLIGRNDVHAVLRRLQWNSPVVMVCGWHLHRHHRGPQFLLDTTNTGWILLSGQNWMPLLGHQRILFHGHGQQSASTRRHRELPAHLLGCLNSKRGKLIGWFYSVVHSATVGWRAWTTRHPTTSDWPLSKSSAQR